MTHTFELFFNAVWLASRLALSMVIWASPTIPRTKIDRIFKLQYLLSELIIVLDIKSG